MNSLNKETPQAKEALPSEKQLAKRQSRIQRMLRRKRQQNKGALYLKSGRTAPYAVSDFVAYEHASLRNSTSGGGPS